ncbi:MAG: RNA methyltransferase [Phycisphaerales bacterium]|nr:RNA methyltransferase [Phycisphaerales bacterium]
MSSTPSPIVIERADDPRLEAFRAVRDRDLIARKGTDLRGGRFLAESPLVVDRILAHTSCVESLLCDVTRAAHYAPIAGELPVFSATHELMNAITGFEFHRGVIASCRRPDPVLLTLDRVMPTHRDALTVLLIDGINNIDNIGQLYRNAAAFGVDVVVLSPDCHDHLYRKTVRVSMGYSAALPTVVSQDWAADLTRLREEFGLFLVAADAGGASVSLESVMPHPRVGIIMGNEFNGISAASRAAAHAIVRIRMAEGIDSLNVATASSICLHRLSASVLR